MIGFIIIVIVIIIVVSVLKAIFSKPKQYSYSVNVHSDSGVRFWINIDNIVQNQQSVPSLSILNIPFVEDTYSVMDIYMDLGNGRMAKANEKPVVLDKCVSRYFILHQTNKGTFVLQPARAFIGQAQVPCCGTNPTQIQHEQYEQPQPSVPQKKQAARKKAPVSKEAAAAQAAAKAAKAAAAAAEKAAKAANAKTKAAKKTTEKASTKTTKAKTATKPKAKSAIDEYIEAVNAFYSQADKKAAIQNIISSNKLTATQIKQLVDLMASQRDILELLEFAYPYCKDKSNYIKTVSILASVADRNRILEMIG